MPVTIISKNGSTVPSDSTLAQGELGIDLVARTLYSSTNGTDIIPVGGGGSGSLPLSTPGAVLIGDNATGWTLANHFTVDDVTVPGLSSIALKGTVALENIDSGGSHMYLTTKDILGGGSSMTISGQGVDDGVIITPEGIGQPNEFTFANGFLALPKEPTADVHATTKLYVDNATGGLQPGTVTNNTVRWSGSAWEETDQVTVTASGAMTVLGGLWPVLGDPVNTTDGLVTQAPSGFLTRAGVSPNDLVQTTGNQTISGEKTFDSILRPEAGLDAGAGQVGGESLVGDNLTPSGRLLQAGALGLVETSAYSGASFVTVTGNQNVGGNKTFTGTTTTVNGNFYMPNVAPANQFTATWNFGNLTYLSSDERLKKNIVDSMYGLDAVLALEAVEFDWKEDSRHDVGLIAQQVQTVIPEAVGTPEGAEMLAMRDGPIISALIKAVQELTARVAELET
jgi:hypothetical protein